MIVKQPDETQQRDGVDAVDRAIEILRCFSSPGEALTLAVLAQRSGLYKSTILRLAASLLRAGFLKREADGRYVLGPELRRLGRLSRSSVSLEPIIRPVLRHLTQATGETASFYVLAGRERVCLFRENSPQSARHHLEEGARHPLGSGAAGQVLSCFGRRERSAAGKELAATGAVVSRGGRDPNLSAVAVPLINPHGELFGALAVSGLIGRFGVAHIDAARRRLIGVSQTLTLQLPPIADVDLGRFEP